MKTCTPPLLIIFIPFDQRPTGTKGVGPFVPRQPIFFNALHEWMATTAPLHAVDTIIYQTRAPGVGTNLTTDAHHGRVIDPIHEADIIAMIRQAMVRNHRTVSAHAGILAVV